MNHASGTIKGTRKNDTTQHKMLGLIVQTKRKYKKKTPTSKNEKDGEGEKENHRSSDDEIAEGSSSNKACDEDSDVSFMKDTDEERGRMD